MAHVANATGSLTAATSSVLGGFPRLPHTSRTIPLFPRFSHLPLAPFGPSCALRHSAKTESSCELMAIPSPACWPRGPGTGRVPVGRDGVGGCHAGLSARPRAGLDRSLGMKIYAPWQLFVWWLAFDAQAPDVFARAGAACRLRRSRQRRRRHRGSRPAGQAASSKPRPMARPAGRTPPTSGAPAAGRAGVVLGLYDGRYLRHDGPEHVLAGRTDAVRQGRRPGAAHAA